MTLAIRHNTLHSVQPQRVVVIGAGGFIGRALTGRLEACGIPWRGIGRNMVDLAGPEAGERLAAFLYPGDSVAVLSAITPDRDRTLAALSRNIAMMAALCTAVERVPPAHLLYVSSDAVYSSNEAVLDENTPAAPVTPYGAMHLTREVMARQMVVCPVAVVRPTMVYGPGDTHDAYGPTRMMRTALRKSKIVLFGEGEEIRDYIHVTDVAEVLLGLLLHRSEGTLNLAGGQPLTFRNLAEAIAGLVNPAAAVVFGERKIPVSHRCFDLANLHKAFPRFVPTPLPQGLAACMAGLG